jgi:hypothetical protein
MNTVPDQLNRLADKLEWKANAKAFNSSIAISTKNNSLISFTAKERRIAKNFLVGWWLMGKSESLKKASKLPWVRKRIVGLAARKAYNCFSFTGNTARFERMGAITRETK